MSFSSSEFLILWAVVFVVYHALSRRFRLQNTLIIVGSCLFYSWFDWRLLFLLLFYAFTNFGLALLLERNRNSSRCRSILLLALSVNLGLLGLFKYFDFFSGSIASGLGLLGIKADPVVLGLLLPIGISFYTFQSIAYVVDVYHRRIDAERDIITYSAYMFFFPQLVAGPIERAENLLAQFRRPRGLTSEDVRVGTWLFVWGLFLKVVIADSAGPIADIAYDHPNQDGWLVVLGTLAFGLQIYADFLAYSLIAKGAAQLLGFELIWNFNHPYWATSIQDFWRRWHISLSSWLRDYLYIPLGGNSQGARRTYINLLITMGLGGLWHGAAWNFLLWGLVHGVALAIHRFWRGHRSSPVPAPLAWLMTQSVVFFGWFLFRVKSLGSAQSMAQALSIMSWEHIHHVVGTTLLYLLLPLLAVEVWQRRKRDMVAPARISIVPFSIFIALLITAIFVRWGEVEYAFIYFQF